MSRYSLFVFLMAWPLASFAQTSEIPGMPSDPTAAEPPPRVNGEPPPQPPPRQQRDADEEAGEGDLPRPPVLPEPMESGEPIEPEVTIIQREGATIEEYRVNGRMYMVKVTPSKGPPYYLIDQDGDGRLETRKSGIYEDPVVPQWILFSW
ncbi:MAG: DUF2782 domain-containing protein [Gammaproteobacteria bacterium]|nr:DUF2782 domain-containing protein [Gammaproteobacteria bacterium]